VDLLTALRVTTGQHFQVTPGSGLTAGIRQTRTRDREAQAVVRYREDTPGELARARATVAAWRNRNPTGTGEEMLAATGRQFHQDYSVVLRTVLFAVDRRLVRQVTGIPAEERRPSPGLRRDELAHIAARPRGAGPNSAPPSVPGRAPECDHRRRRVRGVAGRVPEPDGEHVISRYTCRELLGKLDELTGEHRSQSDSGQD
jgi:hypothetical protein